MEQQHVLRAVLFFFKQKTAYEVYQCDWSSDVCSSDLGGLGDDISDIPAVGMAPEWMSEKAISIATYCVASGAYVIMGYSSPVSAVDEVTRLISEGWESKVKGRLEFIADGEQIVQSALAHIDRKRADLGLTEYDAGKWGRSGDWRMKQMLEIPLEERTEALYGEPAGD